MVHFGSDFPLGYDDGTLQAIQASGGGVVGSIDEALTRLAASLEAGEGALPYDVVDGYLWQVMPSADAQVIAAPGDEGFEALAARQLILAEMMRSRGALDDVDVLDALHAIAVENSVVTPYSSMIVLVTEQQEGQLDRLEKGEDRFEREYEEVGETAELGITAVPEPEEWLLLGAVAAMLLWGARKKLSSLLYKHAA
jgi:putative PEP-CTERM system integral membrane protein